jgi:hypothetical protein
MNPWVWGGAAVGGGTDAVSQGAGMLYDRRSGQPIRDYDPGQTATATLFGAGGGPIARANAWLFYPSMGLGGYDIYTKCNQGRYEEAGLDALIMSLGSKKVYNDTRELPGLVKKYTPLIKGKDVLRQIGNVPKGAVVLEVHPDGKWVIYQDASGTKRIQFDAKCAQNFKDPSPRAPGMPGGRPTPQTLAGIDKEGKVLVAEGRHRLQAAQRGGAIPEAEGGVPGLPGWLDYLLYE